MASFFQKNGRLIFVIAWAFLLFLIATNIQVGWLYVIISFMLLLCFYSWLIPKIALRVVSAAISMPDMAERGEMSYASLDITNRSRISRYLVRVDFHCEGIGFDPPGAVIVRLGGRDTETINARFGAAHRGLAHISGITLSCGAPAGVLTVRKDVRCHANIIVHPKISPGLGEEIANDSGEGDLIGAEKFHSLEDPFHYKLREYTTSDSMKRIHWKLTAKRNKPIVRVNEKKIIGHRAIFIDNIKDHYPDEELFEQAVERAASLAWHLVFVKGTSVSIGATAAPGITVESPEAWKTALKWFALIRLEHGSALYSDSQDIARDYVFAPPGKGVAG